MEFKMMDVALEARIHVLEMLVFTLIQASPPDIKSKVARVMQHQVDNPEQVVIPPGLEEGQQQAFRQMIKDRMQATLRLV
jgi:hypothetical protein